VKVEHPGLVGADESPDLALDLDDYTCQAARKLTLIVELYDFISHVCLFPALREEVPDDVP
jgi:hypothetical protein